MANLQALAVEFGAVFPCGVGMVGEVDRQNDFERSSKDNPVQARDKETGLPVWVVEVIDFDPKARIKTFKVKVVAEHQPVPPEALPGAPIRPLVLEGMTVTPTSRTGHGRGSPTRCGARGWRLRVAGRPTHRRRRDHGARGHDHLPAAG